MDKFCKACAADPTCHSFKKVGEKGGVSVYYSHPSQGRMYDDIEGYPAHIDKMLASNGKKPWKIIINGDGYDLKLTVQGKLGRSLVDLFLQKYNANMKELVIINPSIYIRIMVKLALSTFDESTFAKIKVLDDRPYSILEFI